MWMKEEKERYLSDLRALIEAVMLLIPEGLSGGISRIVENME